MSVLDKPVPYLKRCVAQNFAIALVVSLGLVLVAFKWEFYVVKDIATISAEPFDNIEWVTLSTPPEVEQKQEVEKPKERPKPVVVPPIAITSEPIVVETKPELPKMNLKMQPVAVTKAPEDVDNTVHTVVEQPPVFPGGVAALLDFLGKTSYCPWAKEVDIEGTVYASFVVDQNGKVESIQIERKVFPCLDDNVVARIGEMPKWKPGYQGGHAVKVRMVVPIKFQLN